MFLGYISVPAFIISLAIGLFFVYIIGPEEEKVFVYPNPQNILKTIYKDKADQCFELSANIVDCPSDESLIQEVPMQG